MVTDELQQLYLPVSHLICMDLNRIFY